MVKDSEDPDKCLRKANLFKPTAKKQEHTLLIAEGGDR